MSAMSMVLFVFLTLAASACAQMAPVRSRPVRARDAFSDQDPLNKEGEDTANPPCLAVLRSFAPITSDASVATYWTANPNNATATNAYIMMHGKLRDGANYWDVLDTVLNQAVNANHAGAVSTSIVTAPQFYSTRLNSGNTPTVRSPLPTPTYGRQERQPIARWEPT